MSVSRKIFYNTLAQTAGKTIAIVIGLLSLGLLTRFLQEEGFGQYSIILAILGFVSAVADLGLYMIIVRTISQPTVNTSNTISNIIGLRLTTALFALFSGAVVSLFFPYAAIVKQTMFLGVLAFLFVPLNQALIAIFQKHLTTYLPTFSEIVGRLINLALIYWFIKTQSSLPYFIFALIISNSIIFFLNLYFAKLYEKFSIAFQWNVWKKILIEAWPLAFSVILNLTYFKGDTIILSFFQNEEAVGIYSLPYKILEVLLVFPGMFVGLIMPLLSKYAYDNWKEFRNLLQHSFDAIVILIIPMLITTWYYSKNIISAIKGPVGYDDSPRLLAILIFAAALTFLGTLFGYAVVAIKKEKIMVKGYAIGAATGIVIYFLLIPSYSYYGAAVGTIATELLVMIFAFFLVQKESSWHPSIKTIASCIPPAAGLILFFSLTNSHWLVEISAGIIIYIILLLVFRAVSIDFIRNILFLKKQA